MIKTIKKFREEILEEVKGIITEEIFRTQTLANVNRGKRTSGNVDLTSTEYQTIIMRIFSRLKP